MKCDRCFFCTHIGRGIYAEYPVKYCKYASTDDYCHCKYVTWWNGPDDYCSRAEKRGDSE